MDIKRILMVTIALISCAYAQNATIRYAKPFHTKELCGQIVDEGRAPISSAQVTVEASIDGKYIEKHTTTDESGRFCFTSLNHGHYLVHVQKQNFNPLEFEVFVGSRGKQIPPFVMPVAT